MMYLVECSQGKYPFELLESVLDFVLKDDCYVYNHPEVYRLNGDKFEPFMRFTYRGVESNFHCEDKPPHCDVFDFSFWHRQEEDWPWVHAGWVDDQQNGRDMRETVKHHAIEVEAELLNLIQHV